jgi:6-phosphofructo-2-kinase
MRLKLSGPDYRDKDPVKSLADFKARVKAYESAYEPIGEYEEKLDRQYIQVGNWPADYFPMSRPLIKCR